jgi:hypothetical protein
MGGSKGPTQSEQATQGQITQGQLQIEQAQQANSNQLYNLTEPGLASTENFYQTLASGNPQAIQTATAPATQQIAQNYNQTATALSAEMPRGGARDLALQQSQISKEGAIGSTQANAYLGSFPALASLAGEGIGMSTNEISQALSAFSGASSSNQAAGQMSGAGKAETLGFLGSLGQSAATGAGMALGCYVAIALWGRNNARTVRCRVWLDKIYRKTLVGRVFMWHYETFGEAVAKQVEKRMWVRKLVTPLFEYFDRRATDWERSWIPALKNLGLIK